MIEVTKSSLTKFIARKGKVKPTPQSLHNLFIKILNSVKTQKLIPFKHADFDKTSIEAAMLAASTDIKTVKLDKKDIWEDF